MNVTDLAIPAFDGLPLSATLYEPADVPERVAIVSSATAVPQQYYRAFARELARRGVAAVTYDYRGTGGDVAELKRSKARMRDWGLLDFAGIIAFVRERYPDLKIGAIGHSVGGHVLLLAPNNAQIDRAVCVAAQSGHWRYYRGFERYRIYAFMKTIMPLLTRAYGYFPGELVRFGLNLAPGVLYEWSGWCNARGYFFDDPTMTAPLSNATTLTAPVLMIGLRDDPWATPHAIDALQIGFTNAPVTRVEIDPAEVGGAAIGHLGFFRPEFRESLWPRAFEALGIGAAREEKSTV